MGSGGLSAVCPECYTSTMGLDRDQKIESFTGKAPFDLAYSPPLGGAIEGRIRLSVFAPYLMDHENAVS